MLDGARSLVVLAFAEELEREPAALAAYGAAFCDRDDVTLVIFAPDREETDVLAGLGAAIDAAGLHEDGPDMLAVAIPGSPEAESALAASIHVIYSASAAPAAFAGRPRVAPDEASVLRTFVRPRCDDPLVPVVMCVWKRIGRLPGTLEMLARQRGVRPELHLWVNNAAVGGEAQQLAAAAPFPVHVTVSECNLGGFARFHVARTLADQHPYVVFIDDDQVFEDDALRVLYDEATPRAVVGHWAFQLRCGESYWHRTAAMPGAWAQYIGTGGMIADTELFTHEGVFACPEEFRFVEDLWLSYVAEHELGFALRRSAAGFRQIDDGLDQFRSMLDLKSELLRHLVHSGWTVPAWELSANAGGPSGPCRCALPAAA